MPSIPNAPEEILKKGEQYFQKGKYFQAQELFKGFLARHPGHDKSDYAQFMLAETYFKEEEYPLAAVEYRVIVSDYGYSDYVDDAFFKEAVCSYQQAPKPQLDQTKSFEAYSRFKQFLQTFPNSPLVEEVNRYISLIHEKLARKDLLNAVFYMRRNHKDSAKIYLDKIIQNYPGNDYWAKAMYYKGEMLLEGGDEEGAASLFEEVLRYPRQLDVTARAKAALSKLRNE